MKFSDLAVQKNPIPYFTELRRDAPIFQDPDTGIYLVTREADLRTIAMDHLNFSSVIDPSVFRGVVGKSMEQSDPEVAEILKTRGWLLPNTLLLSDPPEHTRYRRLAQEAFGPKAVNRLREQIRGRVEALLDEIPADGKVDFVDIFAKRLPIWVVCKFIFGASEEHFTRINDWADQFFTTLMPAAPREQYMRTVYETIEIHHFIKDNIDRLRAEPDDDIFLSRLIHANEVTGDVALSDEELISLMHVSLLAGHDTTRQSLANSILEMARQPGVTLRLQQDRKQIANFMDEVLRLNAPANITVRIAVRDTKVGSVTIPEGAMIFMAWGSGNRDEELFADPDRFDIDRPNIRKHLSFGIGLHVCVGVHLARAQLTIALDGILDRYSGVSLTIPESDLDYMASISTRTLVALPVQFSK